MRLSPIVRFSKVIGAALFLIICFTAGFSFSGKAQDFPNDLEISLYSAPAVPGAKPGPMGVVIKADGSAEFTRDNGREGIETEPVPLPDGALLRIWTAIGENDFTTLKPFYNDPEVMDGDWAEITVTARGETHTVRTRNIKVTAFDNISVAINAELPAEARVKYNAILGADYNEVAR